MKICILCHEEKPAEEFGRNTAYKDGIERRCRGCLKIKDAERYQKEKERRLVSAAQYRASHKEEIKAAYITNADSHRHRAKEYRENNPDKFKASQKAYKDKNKDEVNAVRRFMRSFTKGCDDAVLIQEAKQDFINTYRNDQEFKESQDATSRVNSADVRSVKRKEKRKIWVEENRDHLRKWSRNYFADKRENDPEWLARHLEYRTMLRQRNWHNVQEKEGYVKYVPGERITLVNFRDLRGWQQNHCYYCNKPFESNNFMTVDHIFPRSLGGPDLRQNLVLACRSCNSSKGPKIFHNEWNPKNDVEPVTDKFFLTSRMIGKDLTEVGIDWFINTEGLIMLRNVQGYERPLFIVSTFFGSDRNPASEGGKICSLIQKQHDNALILLDREWYPRKNSCLNMLKSKMGIADRGPFARKLDVVEITPTQANTFLDEHHVMGTKKTSAIRLGLTDGDILHAVALFSDKGENYEWDRLALRGHIAGGMSKLMKGLWNTKEYKPIRSFVDSRYADGGGHETVGFKHMGMSPETYQWVFPDRIQHQRYLSNMNKMTSNLLYINPDLDNADNIRANGVFKIWSPKKHIILHER